jgi:hypothetical protein
MCEKDGYIERYYVEDPNDKVDLTIKDMQRYTRNLIEEETNLGSMIESALKSNQKEDEQAAQSTETDIVDMEDLSLEDIEKQVVSDQDFMEFSEFLEREGLTSEDLE